MFSNLSKKKRQIILFNLIDIGYEDGLIEILRDNRNYLKKYILIKISNKKLYRVFDLFVEYNKIYSVKLPNSFKKYIINKYKNIHWKFKYLIIYNKWNLNLFNIKKYYLNDLIYSKKCRNNNSKIIKQSINYKNNSDKLEEIKKSIEQLNKQYDRLVIQYNKQKLIMDKLEESGNIKIINLNYSKSFIKQLAKKYINDNFILTNKSDIINLSKNIINNPNVYKNLIYCLYIDELLLNDKIPVIKYNIVLNLLCQHFQIKN